MKKEFVANNPVWATVYDGHTYIERRVYIDENGIRYIKINRSWFTVCECKLSFAVDVWF